MSSALFRVVRHLTAVAMVATPLWASGSSWGQTAAAGSGQTLMSDAGRAEQREARLPARLPGQMPAILANNCDKSIRDRCMAEANKACTPPYGNGGPCLADQVKKCNAESGC
jgi:hypothetical protein